MIEEYGGDVVCVPVSAKKSTGIDELLEMILLVADVQDLKANPNGHGAWRRSSRRGWTRTRGVAATVLVQEGTLKVGDTSWSARSRARVRAMFDDKGKRTQEGGPSMPVEILGLPEVPAAGDRLEVVADEKAARTLVQKRSARRARLAGQQHHPGYALHRRCERARSRN